MDSPLVTYREPDEQIDEGVKSAFYRNLANAQVIILENEEPPRELKENIAFTTFTKNRAFARYGLFPTIAGRNSPNCLLVGIGPSFNGQGVNRPGSAKKRP